MLRSWGLEPVYPPAMLEGWGYLAGDDKTRGDWLQGALLDPEIRAVVCARGGYGASRLVEALDWKKIAAQGKRFVGFSDITFLHLAWLQKTSWMTFHGPMLASRQMLEGSQESRDSLRRALFAETLSELFPPLSGTPLQTGVASGTLWGGNLSLLISTLGTPWQPELTDSILILEDVSEPPYRLDRMFQQLRQAGILDSIAGLAIGDMGRLKDQYSSYTSGEFWLERLRLPSIPIVTDLPVGHIADNRVVPLGAQVTLDAEQGLLSLSSST